MIKKIILSFLLTFLFLPPVFADSDTPIQMFGRDDCAHCQHQKQFFEDNNIEYRYIDTYQNKELFDEFINKFSNPNTPQTTIYKTTPLTLAGDTVVSGYTNEKTGEKILDLYKSSQKKYSIESALQIPDTKKYLIGIGQKALSCEEGATVCVAPPNTLDIPFFGEVDADNMSVAFRYGASFTLGFLDGFNPCAMWVLIIFIVTLIQVGDRTKMIFVAGTFLLAEAVMYGLILVLWLSVFDFIGFQGIITPIIGAIAIGAGIFFVYEGVFSDGTCKVTNADQRKKISDKIADIAHSPISWISFVAILGLAFSVNIIEFACSVGYPQTFTNILSQSDLGFIDQSFLLLTYLGAYMLDDLIIFAIALVSIEKLGITQKYAKGCNIFGGFLMLILGVIMIFAPHWLASVF